MDKKGSIYDRFILNVNQTYHKNELNTLVCIEKLVVSLYVISVRTEQLRLHYGTGQIYIDSGSFFYKKGVCRTYQ